MEDISLSDFNSVLKNIIYKNYEILQNTYTNIDNIIQALLETNDIVSYFEINIKDNYIYLVAKSFIQDYVFIIKMVQLNNALSKYGYTVILEDIDNIKAIKLIEDKA